MPIAVEDEVRAVLSSKREEKIHKAFMNAWEDWDKNPEKSKYSRWPRTRATMVFERIAARLLEEFTGEPGVDFFFKDETIKFVFDHKVLVRAKKGDEAGLGRNITTQAAIDFCEAQADLPGLEGLQKIEVVYTLNKTATAIEAIIVQARDGDMKLWAYNLGGGAATAEIIPLPLPTQPGTIMDDLVSPKKNIGKTENKDSQK